MKAKNPTREDHGTPGRTQSGMEHPATHGLRRQWQETAGGLAFEYQPQYTYRVRTLSTRHAGALMLALAIALCHNHVFAAASSPWFARVWQSDQGLPDNNVTGLKQTPDGYLWVATHSSVSLFDGVRFREVPVPVPPGRSRLNRAFLVDRGVVVVAMEGGIAVRMEKSVTNIFTTAQGLSGFRPLVVAMDAERAAWIGYADGSVCRLKAGRVTRYGARDGLTGTGASWVTADLKGQIWYSKAGRIGIFKDGVFTNLFVLPDRSLRIGTARNGGVWACGASEIFHCNEETQEAVHMGKLNAEVKTSALFEDRTGALWIGTSAHGLFRLFEGSVSPVQTSHLEIECIAEDREQNIWVGTSGGGLNRIRQRVLELHGPETGSSPESIRSVCVDRSGRPWAVTASGGVALRTEQSWQLMTDKEGLRDVRASCVVADDNDALWIGTVRNGLLCLHNGTIQTFNRSNGLAGDTVRSLMVDRSGDLWAGLESGNCLQRLHAGQWHTFVQPASSRTIRTIVQDKEGTIWLGTSDGFLLRVEKDALVDESSKALPTKKAIRSLYAGEDGSLWICYANAGLGRLRKGEFVIVNRSSGLADDYVCGLVPDETGGIWFSADRGIFTVRRRSLENFKSGGERVLSIPLGRDEGFPSLQGSYGNWPISAKMPDGRILFAMRTGVAVVHPGRLQPNRIPPPVEIERVLVDSRPAFRQKENEPVKVTRGARKVEIEFTGLSFIGPEDTLFRYKMEGWDEDWVEGGKVRSASYSRLPPGTYDFHVTACNVAGIWNQSGARITLHVQPFIWQTWTFRLAATGMIIAALALAIRRYERRKLKQQLAAIERQRDIERERSRIARDIHDDLGAGLAQIGLLADLGAAQHDNVGQAQFSRIAERARLAVKSLEDIVWAANPRNDNLARLADHISQAADECFETGPTRCRKDIPMGLPEVPISAEVRHNLALAVKEALTNAFKHASAATVWVRLKWSEPELVVEIEDDGCGFATDNAQLGNGLSNQSARMNDIGAEVRVESILKKGTKVTFRILLRNPSYSI